jgi:hypothetical protein
MKSSVMVARFANQEYFQEPGRTASTEKFREKGYRSWILHSIPVLRLGFATVNELF